MSQRCKLRSTSIVHSKVIWGGVVCVKSQPKLDMFTIVQHKSNIWNIIIPVYCLLLTLLLHESKQQYKGIPVASSGCDIEVWDHIKICNFLTNSDQQVLLATPLNPNRVTRGFFLQFGQKNACMSMHEHAWMSFSTTSARSRCDDRKPALTIFQGIHMILMILMADHVNWEKCQPHGVPEWLCNGHVNWLDYITERSSAWQSLRR